MEMRIPASFNVVVKAKLVNWPLIRVEDVGPAVAGDRLFKSGDAEVGVHCVRQPPGQHFAAEPVHDGDEVEEAAPHVG